MPDRERSLTAVTPSERVFRAANGGRAAQQTRIGEDLRPWCCLSFKVSATDDRGMPRDTTDQGLRGTIAQLRLVFVSLMRRSWYLASDSLVGRRPAGSAFTRSADAHRAAADVALARGDLDRVQQQVAQAAADDLSAAALANPA